MDHSGTFKRGEQTQQTWLREPCRGMDLVEAHCGRLLERLEHLEPAFEPANRRGISHDLFRLPERYHISVVAASHACNASAQPWPIWTREASHDLTSTALEAPSQRQA